MLAVVVLPKLGRAELWISFGTGKNFCYIPAHEMCASLGPQKSVALPVFHAFTGCDTVSQFAKVGKRLRGKYGQHMMNSLQPSMSCTIHHSKYLKRQKLYWSISLSFIWQDSNMYLYQWSLKASIYTQRQSDVSSSSHQGCSAATY